MSKRRPLTEEEKIVQSMYGRFRRLAGLIKSYHKPTGFPLGRPKSWEVRVKTPGALYQDRRRAREKATNPDYLPIMAMYQQFITLARKP